jgi:orotidine-5'-phosphate decarboxylase
MTQQLKEMIERVKTWPEWRQEDAAYLLEMMEESGTKVYRLSDEERDAVREGLESPVVSPEELKAFRNRHKA